MPVSRPKKSSSRSRQTVADVILSPELLESIPDAIVAVDAQGNIVQINSQTEQMFGYPHHELLGQNIDLLVPERYRQGHKQHRSDFAGQPNIRRMGAGLDLYGRRRDGSEFPVEISLSPIPSGKEMLVLSAIRDISDRKKIEEELRRAHQALSDRSRQEIFEYRTRLAAIVDSSQDAIIAKDLDGTINAWNKGAEHIYGYTAEEMVGTSITRLAPPDRTIEITDILKKIRAGESIEHFESVRIAKDGRRLNVSLSISPISDTSGNIVGASTIARDITEQKRVEDQLRQAQKMEAVGRLAGGIAHDFNNILGIISACTELLRDRLGPESPSSQYIDNIYKASERGASLTRQLLVFSRKQVVQPRVLDLNERLKEVSKLVRPLMGDDVEIVIRSKATEAYVEADPSQLDQIVLNLAVNARDAMPHGGKLILQTSDTDFDPHFAHLHFPMTPGKYVMLAVSDTGIGMDEITLQRIFEPFFTTKEVGKGTGLGLATVYGIVKQAGGSIWVYSEPGRGTTFKIYLPSAAHKLAAVQESQPDVAPARAGATVLLVEDDETFASLTRQMLEEHGYHVLTAKDGISAKEVVHANGDIDLVLTDVVMRGLSGPELVSTLSRSHPALKVVYMSGYTGELIADHDVLHAGVQLLDKPFSRVALLQAVHTALNQAT
jgi:PAS domain S-box-containing protein